MNWSDERYVRLYTRDTPDWLFWSWQSRALLPLLMRKVDRAGVLDLGRCGNRGLAVAVGLPVEVADAGLAGLLEDGCVSLVDSVLVIRNFIEAQESAQTDAQRQRERRARHRVEAERGVTQRDNPSQNVTGGHAASQIVTGGHAASRDVTPAVPAVPAVPEEPLSAGADAAAGTTDRPTDKTPARQEPHARKATKTMRKKPVEDPAVMKQRREDADQFIARYRALWQSPDAAMTTPQFFTWTSLWKKHGGPKLLACLEQVGTDESGRAYWTLGRCCTNALLDVGGRARGNGPGRRHHPDDNEPRPPYLRPFQDPTPEEKAAMRKLSDEIEAQNVARHEAMLARQAARRQAAESAEKAPV